MKKALCFLIGMLCFFGAQAQDSTSVLLDYGDKGWRLVYGENFEMNMQWRLQFRYAYQGGPQQQFVLSDEDNAKGSFSVQRGRLKVGGHAYRPFVKYYLEYDFPSTNLLNWEVTVKKIPELQLKVGQWKIEYNTERFVSSGKQQLVDRSIANRFFTFDRQVGVSVQGDLFEGRKASSTYVLGVFNGEGINTANENREYLWLARYQWNLGRPKPKMSFCDLKATSPLQGFVAVSAVQNVTAYTSFSSAGGGQLLGFDQGGIDRYRLRQAELELMIKYKGFSFMNENHWKEIDDRELNQTTDLYGGYLQTGYFFHQAMDWVPEELELAARFAYVDQSNFDKAQREWTIGANWFFADHRNKLTLDVSKLDRVDFELSKEEYRARIQWDFSF